MQPASTILDPSLNSVHHNAPNYFAEIIKMFPDNIIRAFAENNVLGVALIAAIMGLAMMQLPKSQQDHLGPVFSA